MTASLRELKTQDPKMKDQMSGHENDAGALKTLDQQIQDLK